MAQVPANAKLWAMLTAQARAKFRIYPSPAASHWVHHEYVQKGGKFVDNRGGSSAPRKRNSNSDDLYEKRTGTADDEKSSKDDK